MLLPILSLSHPFILMNPNSFMFVVKCETDFLPSFSVILWFAKHDNASSGHIVDTYPMCKRKA